MHDIDHLLSHNVANIYPNEKALREVLDAGKKLRLYVGVDPTSTHLHIGHAMQFAKLREFQDLGHEVILLIGSFTAMIGDPTDKSATRKQLTAEEVLANAKTYKDQAAKILRFNGENAAKLMFNDEWLSKLTFKDVLELTSCFTVQQMMERDMFEKRFYGETKWKIVCVKCGHEQILSDAKIAPDGNVTTKKSGKELVDAHVCEKCQFDPLDGKNLEQNLRSLIKAPSKDAVLKEIERGTQLFGIGLEQFVVNQKPIGLHEFLYPLMQGFDSVAMDVDLEIGGNDQTFNMLAGRTLMKAGVLGHKPKEKFVMAITLLTNDEGKKMSKSEGGMIALDDAPEDMFGKVMSMGDNMIASYFAQVLDAPESEISAVQRRMGAENPRDIKMELAQRIVARYYDAATAAKARSYFVQVFQEHVAPEEMPEVAVTDGVTIVDALVATRLATSKTTARQLIAEGAVKLGDVIVADDKMTIDTSLLPVVLQKGKRGFVRLVK